MKSSIYPNNTMKESLKITIQEALEEFIPLLMAVIIIAVTMLALVGMDKLISIIQSYVT